MTTPHALAALSAQAVEEELAPPRLPWRCFVCETVTGRVIADVPFAGTPQWAYGINIAGSLQVTVPIGPDDYTGNGAISKGDLRQLRDYWRMSWGLSWGDLILQCGPVVTSKFDDRSGPPALQVGCAGIWALFSQKRVIANPSWTGTNIADAAADLNFTNLTLRQIAKQLVLKDMLRNGALPIVQPADDPAGTEQRAYPGYDLAYVGGRLQELTQVINGPENEFRPEYTDSTQTEVQWRQRIGGASTNGRIGNLAYPHAYDYGSALTQLDEDSDGSRMAFEAWVRGNGMERSLLTGHDADDSLVGGGWPMLQAVDTDHTSAIDQSTLDSWAQADVATYGTEVQTLTATVLVDGSDGQGRRTGSPALAEIQAGDNVALNVVDHRWLPDGISGQRIVQVGQGQTLDYAVLSFQPTGAVA